MDGWMKYVASIFNNETGSVDLSLSLSLFLSMLRLDKIRWCERERERERERASFPALPKHNLFTKTKYLRYTRRVRNILIYFLDEMERIFHHLHSVPLNNLFPRECRN